jgi:hypothetical protein
VRDAAERIMAVRIPDAEQITSAWREGTACFGKGRGLVRKEHQAELADDGVEACIGKGERCGVGRLEADPLARPKFCARKIEHRRIEIGRRQLRLGG